MKKEKKIRLILLLLSLSAFFYFVSGMDFGRSDRYDNLLISKEEFESILQDREEEDDQSIPDIYFDDFSLTHDKLSNTYYYSLIEDSPSRYNPLVRTVSTFYSRYDIAIVGDIMNDHSNRENQTAELILYDNNSYKRFKIAKTTLPIVTVSMNERSDDRENPIGALESPASFTLFDNRPDIVPSERLVSSQMYIRLRGATSRRFSKNQFRVKLREVSIGGSENNNNLSLLGMREDDDWILYSPYNDPEKMRNTLSNNLWHEFSSENNSVGVTNGTQGTYVEVFIDGKYWGIYTLMHPIDRKQLELSVSNNTETSDYYYRAVYNNPFDIEDFVHDGDQYIRGRFELRNPEPNGSADQWSPLVKHLTMIDEDEDKMIDYLNKFTDIENLIDYYLFYILTQAHDNNTKNRNYIAYHTDNGHFMLESPWDLDLTWGLRWTPEHERLSEVRGHPSENFSPSISHITRLIHLGNEEITNKVKDRYSQLRQSTWSEDHMMSIIDSYETMLYDSGAMTRNYKRWPTAAYAEDTSEFRQYILNRLIAMDEYLNEILGGE